MPTVIGLVIHASHRPVFEEAARTPSGDTRLEWVTYRSEEQIRPGVRALLLRTHVDGLLLGQVPFARAQRVLPAGLPVEVIRAASLDLSLALGRALAQGRRPVPVSVDTFGVDTVHEVVRALGLDPEQVGCLPYDAGQGWDEIVEFHRGYARRTGAQYAITARTAVSAALAGTTAVITAPPGAATIRAALDELALRIQSRRASAARFAAGVFQVREPDPRGDVDRARIGLLHLLANTPEYGDAWIENRDRRGVLVFAHKALFERATSGWASLPVLRYAREALGIRLAAGFGVGTSARTCVGLAEQAVARAEQEDQPAGYLLDDSGALVGPIGGAGPALASTYRDHGGALEDLARRAGLSPATLSRLAALERSLAGRAISPSDLATSLGITDPSGRRLIRVLGRSGLATGDGSVQVTRKGRPTRLYRLDIDRAMAAAS